MGSDDGNKSKQHDNNLVNIIYTNYTKCISCFGMIIRNISRYNYYQWLYRYIRTNLSTTTNPNNTTTMSTRKRRVKYRTTEIVGVYITLGVFCFIVVMFLVIIPWITTILVNNHHYNNWFYIKLLLLYISPEYYVTDTFTRNLYNDNDYKVLPSHCQLLAKQFDYCQQQYQYQQSSNTLYNSYNNNNEVIVTTAKKPTIVYGCHRRWCQSLYGGHCEPCSGLGDRYRFLISQINTLYNTNMNHNNNNIKYHNNHKNNIRQSIDDITCNAYIQIDSPIIGLQQLRSTLYIDYNSWWNEIIHERSYDVSQRHVLSYQQIIQQQSQLQVQNYGTNDNIDNNYYYTHFTPNQYGITNDYNACYFHILYQPDYTLQNDIKYHWNAILSNGHKISNKNNNNIIQQQQKSNHPIVEEEEEDKNEFTIIGIHYRTGDAIAFNIHNLDERVHENQLLIGWKKLYNCSISLMKQIMIHSTNNNNHNIYDNNSNTNSIYKNVRFYLATDNPTVKDYVRQNYAYNNSNINYESSSSSEISIPVYVTDIQPFSYLRGNVGDRTALLELYLLSKCNGIVVNTLPSEGYNGTAHTVSQFAMFAKKIGFIPNTNFYQCSLD